MKKSFLTLMLVTVTLTSCDNIGSLQAQPYSITMSPWGYELDDKGRIVVPSVTVRVFSKAGAPDINRLDFTATLLNGQGNPTVGNDSQILTSKGTLMSGIKGGYQCVSTSHLNCVATADDAFIVASGPEYWPQNVISEPVTPGEWAVWHLNNFELFEDEASAAFQVKVDFIAYQANGSVSEWTQRYQFVSPAE